MKLHWQKQSSETTRLLLIFSGWSVDWHLFARYDYPAGYDVAVVWDYTVLSNDIFADLRDYDETVVIAWSFGVASFNVLHQSLPSRLNLNCAIAVNGTISPVDDNFGIPENIFSATLSGLSDVSLKGFQRRICGGGNRYKDFKDDLTLCRDDITSLKNQLETFSPEKHRIETWKTAEDKRLWDRAFISTGDLIFPPDNMKNAWNCIGTPIISAEGSHLPDFQHIIDTVVRDKSLIGQQFNSSNKTYEKHAEVQIHAARQLMALWSSATAPAQVLEIGPGSGTLSREIATRYPEARLTWIDLTETSPSGCNGTFLHGDAEIIVKQLPNEYFDAIFSANSVQWFHSPMRFLINASKLLKKGGKIALSTFAPGTLNEITEINGGTSLPYLSDNEWQHFAKTAGFETEKIKEEKSVLKFTSGRGLADHLKKTGVNALTKSPRKDNFALMRNLMSRGECTLTFNPLYIILKKQ